MGPSQRIVLGRHIPYLGPLLKAKNGLVNSFSSFNTMTMTSVKAICQYTILGLGPSDLMKGGEMNSRNVPVKRSFYNLMDNRFKNDDFMDNFMPSKRFDIDSPFDSF